MNKPKHIAIAGNIGSGKTTLTSLLAKHYGWEAHYEIIDDNPYINDFYLDMQRWSFNLQIYFLHTRFKQLLNIKKSGKSVIQDRTIYEDAYIFAPNLHDMGLMSMRDYNTYFSLFNLLLSLIEPPDLIIYLKASVPTLVKQIQKRGRKFEENIRLDYLKKLNDRYDEWISSFNLCKVLTIDIDNLNFNENPQDLSLIIDKINAILYGVL